MLKKSVSPAYLSRRQKLVRKDEETVFILPSPPEVLRNPDVHYPFRQESNFYYLTGFEEPESVLILRNDKMVLFVRPRDPEMEMWEGERHGLEGAKAIYGADEVYSIHDFTEKLPEFLKGMKTVAYRVGLQESIDRTVIAALEKNRRSMGRTGKSLAALVDPNGLIAEQRLFKDAEELDALRKACQISALAHQTAMETITPGMNEFEVEALIDYIFRKNGCQRVGYGSIVAGGKNATCLHYRHNNEVLREGELLLIDAGGEFDYFTSDITRTFPVGKKFSDAQAAVYDVVLKAQKDVIAAAKPGVEFHKLHRMSCELLSEGLLALGVLQGSVQSVMEKQEFRRFFPHGTGHWLGMDVHDVGLYYQEQASRKLEPGMVFTVEPGLYFQPGDLQAPEKYRTIGIRIEDDILITATGNEVLTRGVAKERSDIEALRAKAFRG